MSPLPVTFLLLLLALHRVPDQEGASLAERIRDGDRDAFRQFFDAHHASLYRYLRSRGIPPDVTDDVVQNAFVYIWENRDRIDPAKSLRAYLFSIGHTRSLNHFRDTARIDYSAELGGEEATSTPDADAEQTFIMERLHAAIQALPDRRRAVFELCFMRGLTYREAAEALDISKKTVEHQMGHALKAVRAALEAYRSEP